MSDDAYRYYPNRHAEALHAVRNWLSQRSAETWLFFAVGIILGTIVG